MRGRILRGRVEVGQRGPLGAGRGERAGQHPVRVARRDHHAPAQLRRRGADARIGQRLGHDRIARPGPGQDHGGQRGLRAGAHHQPRGVHPPEDRRQPERPGRAVRSAAAAKLVGHQQVRVAAQQNLVQATPQQVLEIHARRRRRDVHAHVDHPRQFRARRGDEGAKRAPGLDQLAPPGLVIGARDGGQVDAEGLRQAALRRHPIAGHEPSFADCPFDEIDDLQIPGATGGCDPQIPFGREFVVLYGFFRQNFPRCMGFVFE
ncbi:hypothetical protein D9M72_463440 [compost metagenome]